MTTPPTRRPHTPPGLLAAFFAVAWLAPVAAALAAAAPAAAGEPDPATADTAYQAYVRARTPGAEHELLAGLAGELELTSRFWLDPAGEPELSVLPARRRMILDGRVLELEAGPDAGGFRGRGMMGFDNTTGRYWYVWTDTSATGVATLTGELAEDGSGELSGMRPTAFGPAPLRIEIRREGGVEVHDYFEPGAGGGEVRFLELRYQPRAGR